MENITEYFHSIGLQFNDFWIAAGILLIGTFLLSIFGRFIFGKRSALNNAVSSAIGILFIYGITVILQTVDTQFSSFIAPLPFVNISEGEMTLFSFENSHYTIICLELLNMIILSFLVNIADGWLPTGKSIFSWVFFRCLTVVIAYMMHFVAVSLIARLLPEGLLLYAPTVLLCILITLLLTGALKIIVGALISTVNPIIGGLYTFFFATIIGKQITKAVLTTAILSALVIGLEYVGITSISIVSAALLGYIPFVVIVVVLWYVVRRYL